MQYSKESNETVTFTKDEFINSLELTFVEGAVYETFDGDIVKSCRSGKYWTCDCEYLTGENKGLIYLVKEDELKKFIGWDE